MELEPVLTSSKWQILRILSERKASPTEIAKEINTTIANISQQLRLLEAYGLVKKERTAGKAKNRPRKLYSIAEDSVYFVAIAEKFAEKKKIRMTAHKKMVLKIWSIEKEDWQIALEKFCLKANPILTKAKKIAIDTSQPSANIIIQPAQHESAKEFEKHAKSLGIKFHAVKELKEKKEVIIIFENE